MPTGKGIRNADRKSGKAAKQNPGRKGAGSRRGKMDEGTKVLFGQGLYITESLANNRAKKTFSRDGTNKKDTVDYN